MKFISYTPGLRADLEPHGAIADQVHLFDEREVRALNAALAAGRPLLVRGEPGIGKSQLARAAAKMLKRTFIQQVVDSQTESRDLLWRLDSLGRLAEAQLAGALRDKSVEDARADFAIEKFVVPGPLWWGFDWPSAERQAAASARARVRTDVPERGAEADPDNGSVVLIDEIDKAEAEVPNGLLEALGSGRIAPPGCGVVNAKEPAPLVVITTNEELYAAGRLSAPLPGAGADAARRQGKTDGFARAAWKGAFPELRRGNAKPRCGNGVRGSNCAWRPAPAPRSSRISRFAARRGASA